MKLPSMRQRKAIVKAFVEGRTTIWIASMYGMTIEMIEAVIRLALREVKV